MMCCLFKLRLLRGLIVAIIVLLMLSTIFLYEDDAAAAAHSAYDCYGWLRWQRRRYSKPIICAQERI